MCPSCARPTLAPTGVFFLGLKVLAVFLQCKGITTRDTPLALVLVLEAGWECVGVGPVPHLPSPNIEPSPRSSLAGFW